MSGEYGYVQAIIDRLTAIKGQAGIAMVGTAEDFTAASETAPTALPAVFVFEIKDEGSNAAYMTPQQIKVSVCIAIAAQKKGVRGGASSVRDLRWAVRNRLCAWPPLPTMSGIEFVRGSFAGAIGNVEWWLDEFVTDFYWKPEA